MSKYGIFEFTRVDGVKDITYGKLPINMDYRLIEGFVNFGACSGQYHAGRRALKEIEKLYHQALKNRADPHTIEMLQIALRGDGYPEAPYMDALFDRLGMAQMTYLSFEREATKTKVRLIGKRREPLPGSLLAMTPEELEDFRAKAEALGYKSRV